MTPGHTFTDQFGEYTVENFLTEDEHGRLWAVRTPEGWVIHMYEAAIPDRPE